MRITRQATRQTMAVVGVAVAVLATGAPAQASDASLRTTVAKQEKRLEPRAARFAAAVDDAFSAVGIEKFTEALAGYRSGTRSFRRAVVKEKATSAKVKRGRTQLLAALDAADKALTTYRDGLEIVVNDEVPEKARPVFARAAARLRSAITRTASARKVIGAGG